MRDTVPPPSDAVEYTRWLLGIVRLPEGARLRGGIHTETLKRDAKRKGQLLNLGERAVGVRRWFALMLPDPNAKQDPASAEPVTQEATTRRPRAKQCPGETAAETAWRAERFGQSQPASPAES
jgi:hypothetical protein